ncbi:MAG: acyl CoA:acetate/3-ketoacid CoA transferase, partial [Gammaproteobacteria bacterium]|nr:acyl CoA:acetate/3-ketoacid CoA transferase [Gammaproteobacteria bacterium]
MSSRQVLKKIIPVEDAVSVVQDGDVLATSGYGGHGMPEQLLVALEKRFLETARPKGLTLIHATGQGDAKDKGLNRLAHEGLLQRVIGGYFGLTPKISQLVQENKIQAYNLPEGVITHQYRDIAAGKPGTLSRVGLGTFVDPRLEGGKMNPVTVEDIVELMTVNGKEYLFYKTFPINVVFIRATTADPDGNVTMEKEALVLENLALAMAARNSHGYVICQVERVAAEGSLDSRHVRLPGVLVDAVVVAEPQYHTQTYGTTYNPALSGEVRIPIETLPPLPLDDKKVIARRAAMELLPNSVVNLGIGLPDSVGRVASEEKIYDLMTLTVDPGVMGGVPAGGADFGAAINCQAVIDHCSQFDFIDGGGLDCAFLGFAECDRLGNVNASRFAGKIAGCGGFINISQNAKKVVFIGNFTARGAQFAVDDGRLRIVQEGKVSKFVEQVVQVTFSGTLAAQQRKDVLYVTERCVFRLTSAGLTLTEVAPGVDIERDVLRHLPFRPHMDQPATMDVAIFASKPMGLRERMLDIHIDDRLSYDAASNTVFMNYAGMRVRNAQDVDTIIAAVDRLLEPLGKRVNSIVNYEGFSVDDEAMDTYMDAVRYVEKKYYLKVSRFTNSGFLRLKLGKEL